MSRTYKRHAYSWYQYSSVSYLKNTRKEEGEFNYHPRARHRGCTGSRYYTSHWQDVLKSVHYDHYSYTNVNKGVRKTSKQQKEIEKIKTRKEWRRRRRKVKVVSYTPKTTPKPSKPQFYKPRHRGFTRY